MYLGKITNNYNKSANNCVIPIKNRTVNTVPAKSYADYNAENIKANLCPVSFKGNAPEITRAYMITSADDDIDLQVTKINESYVVDFDSQTEVIYGRNAIDFLKNNSYFKFDTQVIFPKKAEGTMTIDGKEIPLHENTGVIINKNSNAKFNVKKGYPLVVMSKRDYSWYDRYGNNSDSQTIQKKFEELMLYNSKLYNGEFTPNIFLPAKYTDVKFLNTLELSKNESKNYLLDDLLSRSYLLSDADKQSILFISNALNKMVEKGILLKRKDGYVKFSPDKMFERSHFEKYLKENGFDDKEIELISPIQSMIRQVKIDAKLSLRNPAENIPLELQQRLEEKNLIFKNKKNPDKYMYWKKCYNGQEQLRDELRTAGFNVDEQDLLIDNWHKANKIGFDLTGLKFVNDNIAVYNLNDKLNNWTLEGTNWVTNSTAISSQDGTTPFIGVSMVQRDKKGPVAMKDIRKEEKLHVHPNREDRRQTEVYLVTSGAAALNVVKNGKSSILIIKEGELAIVDPGVPHCVNSILGEYEHIVVQVPSAFQYGFEFKQDVKKPDDYDEETLTRLAFEELQKEAK